MSRLGYVVLVCVSVVLAPGADTPGADWPQWRCDARRSASSLQAIPDNLHLLWRRDFPPLKPAFWQVRQRRVQFDLGYEPVVVGKTLLVGSSRNDRVTGLDTETGDELWRFYADGPVRLAPAVWQGKVFFASDDGCLYCLDISTGGLVWKRRATPSPRKVMGNGRLISVWPARGGPVVADGRVYFAAGVWPFEGIFVYALDTETGEVIWVNDRCGSLYLQHPHGAASFGGPSPQGYLLIHGDRLVVPSSRAFPAFFELDTGKLAVFDFGYGGHGSRPGSWFVATDAERRLVVDPEINTESHDVGQQTIGQAGVRRADGEQLPEVIDVGGVTYRIEAGVASTFHQSGRTRRFQDGVAGVEGQVHTMLGADDKLFVVTRSGSLYCFGATPTQKPKHHAEETEPLVPPRDKVSDDVRDILDTAGVKPGCALVLGLKAGGLVEELAIAARWHVVAVDSNAAKVNALRRRLDRVGLYGTRVAVHQGEPLDSGVPPYLASLVVSENLDGAGIASGRRFVERLFRVLRPYGGVACLKMSREQHDLFAGWCREAGLPNAQLEREGEMTRLVRHGPPPGAADFTGEQNFDGSLKSPFGLLWFGDTFHHHKLYYKTFQHETGRGLPTNIQVVGGMMRYQVVQEPYGPNPKSMSYHAYLRFLEQHRTYSDALVDVYTGRIMSQAEAPTTAVRNQEPPLHTEGNLWTIPSVRRNPLTGLPEGREFLKTYGCDQTAVDYGHLCTMRSGTPAYYDKRLESGTVNISGLRSGCRNSIVPACGVLSLPSWTGNCTCNYPIYTSLALTPMTPEFEQWSAWGGVAQTGPIERVGINFGAPGDRTTDDGTLWLDIPSVGGPSPEVPVRVSPPETRAYYRHSLWIEGGSGWPWVTASGVEGVREIRIQPVAKKPAPAAGTISMRWAGHVEPEFSETYTFFVESNDSARLWIGDKLVVNNEQTVRRGERGEASGKVTLESGVKAQLRVECFGPRQIPAQGERRTVVRWSSPSTPKSVVPQDRLFTADRQPGGLSAAYYDTKFSGPSLLAVEPRIEFDWGRELPSLLRPPEKPVTPHAVYTVELHFAEPENLKSGQRVFSVAIQGKDVLTDFDIVEQAGGPRRGVVRKFPGIRVVDDLRITFLPKAGQSLVCGLRLVAEGR